MQSFDSSALGIVQRLDEQKHLLVHLERQARSQRHNGIDLAAAVIRSLVCRFKAFGRTVTAEQMAEKLYRGAEANQVQQALRDLPGLIARATTSPAATGTATWAAELTDSSNYTGLLPSLAPASAYAALSGRGLRVSVKPNGSVKLPARSATPTLSGDFIAELAPIPVRKLGLTVGATLTAKKLAVISTFTLEMAEYSTPTIEAVIKQEIADDTSLTLDTRLLDNVVGSAIRPPGLLFGATVITATAGGGLAALTGDLGALAAAITAPADLVYIMTPADATRAMALAPGLVNAAIVIAPGLTAKQVIALDAADFVSCEGDAPRFDVSSGGTLHEDDAPLPLSATGSPNTVAAPIRSLWQTDAAAIRLIQFVGWAMRRSGRVATTSSVTW